MIRFWCSACGHDLEAEPKLAGRAMACGGCGTVVEVPNNPAPLLPLDRSETDYYDTDGREPPTFPAADAAAADRGLRYLQISVLLYFLSWAVTSAATAGRVAIDGLDTIFSGDPGTTRWLLILGGLLSLGVGGTAVALRFRGYGHCRRVGQRLAADGGLTVGRFAVIALIVGAVGVTVPPFFASSPPVPNLIVMVLNFFASVLVLGGTGAEFAVLGFHASVLRTCGDRRDIGRVKTYALTFGGLAAADVLIGCVTYVGIFIFVVGGAGPGGRLKPGATPAQMLAALPPEAWFGLAVLAAVSFALALVLSAMYWNILAAARRAVRTAAAE